MKTIDRRQVLSTMLAAAGAAAWPRLANAQGAAAAKWPVATIKFIAPVPPGGGVDVFCRQLGERMAHHLGVTVVVENRAGAGGLLGAKALAMAPADGSTLGYLHSGHASIQAMGGKLDLLSEFKPVIGRFQASAFAVVVHADSPYQTFADLLKVLTEQPDKLSYGSGGLGTPAHIIFEKLKAARPGLSATQIPYKGAIEGVNALMGKNIDFLVGLMSTVLGPIKGGKLRALAVSSPARRPSWNRGWPVSAMSAGRGCLVPPACRNRWSNS